jgi:hypothetical protein
VEGVVRSISFGEAIVRVNTANIFSAALLAAGVAFVWRARAESELVQFPENFASGVHLQAQQDFVWTINQMKSAE